jgi:putative restriction endonuclease
MKLFGHVPGVKVGQVFPSRAALRAAGLHAPRMAGIHGTQREGADSIVVSGGYIDDVDDGDVIIYTGAGGNDPATKRQVADQSLGHPNNAGLVTDQLTGLPVRVIRGAHPGSGYAPSKGFRYDGLFAVVTHWVDYGRDGFQIVRFRLEQLTQGQATALGPQAISDVPSYATTTITRRIRDSRAARRVKAFYDDKCQICGLRIELEPGRGYSEGAHVRPLGKPHVGPDDPSNILCLCPNHHVLLDNGGITISPELDVRDRNTGAAIGSLTVHPKHHLAAAVFEYLQEHVFPPAWPRQAQTQEIDRGQ